MPSESSTTKVSLSSKPTESRCLAIANLPETATEETVKECFKRYGRVLSVRIDDQRFAFVAFLDVRIASKAHNAENILDAQRLRTAFHDGSNSVPKALLEPLPPPPPASSLPASSSSSSSASVEQPSPLTSTVIDPSFLSSPNISTVTNSLSSKTMNGDRDKRPSRTHASPDDNVRHQVVPVKRDSDSSGSKRKSTSNNISKTPSTSHPTVQKPSHRKHENSSTSSSSSSSSESERSSDDSISCNNHHRNPTKSHASQNDSLGQTKILKIYHLPPKTPKNSIRELLWNLFVDFKKSGRLLTVKVDGESETRYALLTFRKSEDVEKALLFATTKSINGTRLKAEPCDPSAPENEEYDLVKRSTCSDPDNDEYSVKATRTLYIGNLQSEISYNELRETYSAYGDIIELEIKRQTQSQHQLPFAFVQYADIKSVVKAMKAFESKLNRDHSIKLGFGKNQPTNVLWLDDLPVNITESVLRTFIIRTTNLPNDKVLDIYIDSRNSQWSQTAQCLIYFSDTRAAQEAINLIRGKKIESKRIQVDFASKVFVTRFSDIIEETSHKKNYVGYPSDSTYHGESRSVTKRNGTAREIVPETIQTFDTAPARTNTTDRWPNAYTNSNRLPHKNDSRHSSDRRHSKEYGKGASNSLISIPSLDNGTIAGSSLTGRRHRLSTSSKDSLSNNLSSGRNVHRSSHIRRHPSSTSTSSSRSSSTSSHPSSSTNSLEHRSTSHQKQPTAKHNPKSSKKPSKSSTTNVKPPGKKTPSTKEHSIKSSRRSRLAKSEKDDDPSSTITPACQQPELVTPPGLTLNEQIESIKKEPSPPKQPSTIHSVSSPKAALKNTERVFDWLMQNHHQDSNSSMGLDTNDDDETLPKRKPDDDSLENVSDEQTSKTSPPIQNNNSTSSTNIKPITSPSMTKNSKNEKSSLTSSYRLQPIRTGSKRDEQIDNSLATNETHISSSPPPPLPPPPVPPPSIPVTVVAPPSASSALSLPVNKDDLEQNSNHRRVNKTKYPLSTNQTKKIPLDSQASYDQLDVRLKSYPSLFNDHFDSIRLPFPQFAFEHIKTSTTSSKVLVVLNPKAHLQHSSLGLNNPSTAKHDTSIDTNNNTNNNGNDDDSSTARIPLDERIRLLDKQMYEMNHGQQIPTTSSSSSSSSSSLSPATLIEQQNQKSTIVTTTTNSTAKSVNELALTLSSSTSSATLNQCIQAARAALSAQPIPTLKTPLTIPSTTPFSFPNTTTSPLNINRTISVTSSSPVNISSVLATPPPTPFPSLQRLNDPTSNSILNNFHAAIAQTQIAVAAAKYNSLPFPATLHPPPPPVPASLISPSLTLNSTLTTPALNTPSTNHLISAFNCPPPPPPPPVLSLPTRTISADLLSPSISDIPSSSFPESTTNSPSTSSVKILERLGPSAKFKRKPIPPPLAVITTPTTSTTAKESTLLPSPGSTTPTNTTANAHHSPVTVSSPVPQHQQSNSSTGLKSILKQRSLSNPSSVSPSPERKSPTNERKSSTNYVSPLASSESRSTLQNTSANNRSTSVDSTTKRTPPTTPIAIKKKSLNQQDNNVFTNDIDERQADEKKSTWRTPPTKQTLSTESTNAKKQVLDKIPKKNTSITTKPNLTKPVKVSNAPTTPTTTTATTKIAKTTRPTSMAPLCNKVPQLTLERIDPKSLKTSADTPEKLTPKPMKLKRMHIIQSDSDTEKKPPSTPNIHNKPKKSLLNNEITKRKQQHQQKPTMIKKNPLIPAKNKPSITVKKRSSTEAHSSASELDEKKVELPVTHSDDEQVSSDNDDKHAKDSVKRRTKSTVKTKDKTTRNSSIWRDLRQDTSMYDRIKKRARIDQSRHSSLSTSDGHVSDGNSENDDNHHHRHNNLDDDKDDDDNNDDDDDDDDDDDRDDNLVSSRSNHTVSKRHNVMSDTSDSDQERSSKSKTKMPTVFDNNIFDAEDSDERSKPIHDNKKIEQQTKVQVKNSPILKTNNEQPKKDQPLKVNDEQTTIKKKISVPKTTEKKNPVVNPTRTISKLIKTTNSAQKRPSTDEVNEPTKKLKTDGEKTKTTSIEQQKSTKTEATVSICEKPAIIITSPVKESSPILTKADEPSNTIASDTNLPTTPNKFGIVFASHRRQSTATSTSSSIRTQLPETSTNHEKSKHDDEDVDDDTEPAAVNSTTIMKDDSATIPNTSTLKPPGNTSQPPLSDDETLNPETMQLSDLIGGGRREGAKPLQSRSTTKNTGKGKRITKQDTSSNKRQPVKTNSKSARPVVSDNKAPEPSIVPVDSTPVMSVQQASSITTSAKRLSATESPSASSPNHDKEAKRLRTSTDDPILPVKLEPVDNPSIWTNIQVKEEAIEPTVLPIAEQKEIPSSIVDPLPSRTTSMEIDPIPPSIVGPSTPIVVPPATSSMEIDPIPTSTVDSPPSRRPSMEIDPIPTSSSLISTTHSPPPTSTETENAIKAVYSSIQIPISSISKVPNLDKSVPIIAPISKETLPLVEHQPTSITTTSILPAHVSIKSSITSTAFNENVEETLSAVNSLLMLNNNPPNPSGDHPALKGTARVTPTISKPVYSLVASLPSPTSQQSRLTPTTNISTPTTQPTDLITLVSNIVSSSNLNGDKQSASATTSARSHIEEVIDDVAKGGLTATTPTTTTTTAAATMTTMATTTTPTIIAEPTTSIVDTNPVSSSVSGSTGTTKSTSIPHILRDVMKTPCPTSSTTTPAFTTATTVTSETLNLFDSHRRSTSPLKTTTPATTTTTSSTPVVPVVVRPTVSKTSTSHKRSSTPKTDQTPSLPSAMLHPFPHLLSSDSSRFAAAAAVHHSNFSFSLFPTLTSTSSIPTVNPSSNLLTSPLISNSPPLSARTPLLSNTGSTTNSHVINNPFLNTIMSGQQPSLPTNTNHTHERTSRRDSTTKVPGISSSSSSSSSNRSTPIQQTVPVPIALTIPSSNSGTTANVVGQQQQQQASPLLSTLDAAAAAIRQQSSPLQSFLGPDSVVPFRNVYSETSELYGTPPGIYPSQNMAYAAAQQMFNVISMTGSHHSSAAALAAEFYSNADSFLRLNPPTNELSRDPYNVQWQGNLILKNDQAYVKTQLVAGSPQIARASMNYWNSDSPCSNSSNLPTISNHNLRISQRMRLEQAQLEGVQKRMQMDNDHCILIAEPNGSTPDEIRIQQNNLKNGVIRYFDEKKAAGIVNVLLPGASQPAYVVHIFPPCQFASEILQKRAPDTYRCVVQNKIEQIYLLIVITSTVQ